MTYKELKAIYNKRIDIVPDNLPTNAFDLAFHLNIRVKNSLQCKTDYGEDYPLLTCNACLSLFDGEYIIHHDERYPYKNFAVAHEIAHYLLGHTTDGIEYHHDAQLLAAIIIAPPKLLKKSSIKSATELALQCKIPIDVASEYYSEIMSIKKNKTTNLNDIITDIKSLSDTDKEKLIWFAMGMNAAKNTPS